MIERYTRPAMGRIWTEQVKYEQWLKIELAVCQAWAQLGKIPQDSLKTILEKASFNTERVNALELEVKHDVIAFLTSVAEFVGPDSRFIHMGMTSSDLLDTAFAAQLKLATEMLEEGMTLVLADLKKLAHDHKLTPQMGRSHGIHAEPITFGLKCAMWYDEFKRQQKRLQLAKAEVAVGKISGAVGTFAHLPPSIEEKVCSSLGLGFEPISNQVVQRDRHAQYFSVLAGIAASIEKIAVEIRHLQRTEVFEVAENFGSKQKGSSAMPHKRNPILCENLTGLARLMRSYSQAALENVALWHERDISHSSVERVIGADATITLDFMLHRLHQVLSTLDVFPERMLKNLHSTGGLYASQTVLLRLIEAGMTREDAYKVVQTHALKAWNESKSFRELLAQDAEVKKHIPAKDFEQIFSFEHHMKHVDTLFKRVFGSELSS